MSDVSEAGDYAAPDLFAGESSKQGGKSPPTAGNAGGKSPLTAGNAGKQASQARPVGPGLVREMEAAASAFGRGPVPYDRRKYKYDMYRAQATNVAFAVTRDDRMSAEEAGNELHKIHLMFGIATEEEHLLRAFDNALFFAHTVNSGSMLQPGRSKVYVQGNQFDMMMVITALGGNNRRFFRAYADDIAQVNKAVLAEYDPYDHVKAEHHGWLMQVALERGLQKFPYLAHDSADACVNINIAERIALSNSKRYVIGSTINAVDRAMANPRIQSAGGYDSTNDTVQAA